MVPHDVRSIEVAGTALSWTRDVRLWMAAGRRVKEARSIVIPLVLPDGPKRNKRGLVVLAPSHRSSSWRVEYWPAVEDLVPVDLARAAVDLARRWLAEHADRLVFVESQGSVPRPSIRRRKAPTGEHEPTPSSLSKRKRAPARPGVTIPTQTRSPSSRARRSAR